MSDLMLDVGTANELKMAFRRAGYTAEDVKKLGVGDFAAMILPILRGTGVVQIVKHIINLLVAPFPKEWKESTGWKNEFHDSGSGELEWDPSMANLYLSEQQSDGKRMTGHALWQEIKDKKIRVLNACVLEFLLAHPFLIPESWKTAGAIFFWGTIYSGPRGDLYVRYLYWRDGAWRWSSNYLGDEWRSGSPAASLAS